MKNRLNHIDLRKVFFLMSVVLFSSCNKNSELLEELSDKQLYISANSKLASSTLQVQWNHLDSLGVHMKYNGNPNFSELLETNRKFTFNASSSTFELSGNPIYYPSNRNVDLISYAPYKEGITSTYPIDVSNQSNLKVIDLLYSNSAQNISKQNDPIPLTFNHALSKVVFSLVNFDSTTAGLEDVSVSLKGFPSQADFDLSTGNITNAVVSSSSIAIGSAREAIIIPNTNLANKTFSFTLDGITYDYILPTSDSFEKGTIYNYQITINNKIITVSRSNIAPWIANTSGIDDTGTISTDPIEYVYIPAGTFRMGAPDTSNTIYSYEKPQHWVRISKSFYMSKHEITNSQYADFLNANGVVYNKVPKIYHNIDNESTYLFYSKIEATPYFENNKWVVLPAVKNYPIQGVTWHGALAYAKWKGATLPTEAQWEYAYRATTNTKFFTGNLGGEMMAYGYYHNNTGGKVKPVGEKLPNPWGLHDIAGNVLEWCLDGPKADTIISSYPVAHNEFDPIVDPVGKISNNGYAYYRGGNYSATVQLASAYSRNSIQKEYSAWQIGFRIVLNPINN